MTKFLAYVTFVLCFSFSQSQEIELTTKPPIKPDKKVSKFGEKTSLICKSDAKIQECVWKKDDGQSKCSLGGEGACADWNNTFIKVSSKQCTLTFEKLELDHRGKYECRLNSSETAKPSNEKFEVVVVKKPILAFEGHASDGPIKVPLNTTQKVICSIRGGFPLPMISASLVEVNGMYVRKLTSSSEDPSSPHIHSLLSLEC